MDTNPILNQREMVRISKFLSLVLRHKPQTIGLILDENGWADTDDLLLKLKEHTQTLSIEELKWVVQSNDKKRFSFSADLKKIRANQGHSIDIDLALNQAIPPVHL